MNVQPKSLSDQVIVITGASSGIGLATARLAAAKGARLVLVSQNENDLWEIVQEIESRGGTAVPVGADVADRDAVDRVAAIAQERFGGFDTWVNNAATAIYGKLVDTPLDEKRRLFDVTFWGTVHGCRAAVQTLRDRGGTIINVGSIVSERALPLQGAYVAAKHAIKGYTETLRMELEADGLPINVTLVKPGSIDTPFTENATVHMESEPTYPPPVYSPEVVARTILYCAEHPRRDVRIGAGAKGLALLEKLAPRLADRYMERTMFRKQRKEGVPAHGPEESTLHHVPSIKRREIGSYGGHVRRSSLSTFLSLRPVLSGVLFAGIGAGAIALFGSRIRGGRGGEASASARAGRSKGEMIPADHAGRPWNLDADKRESGMAA